jgi:hypothetical protein
MPMKNDRGLPESFFEKYPKMQPVAEALEAFFEDRPVTSRCLECDHLLVVDHITVMHSTWVLCPNGCTLYHEQGHLDEGGDA